MYAADIFIIRANEINECQLVQWFLELYSDYLSRPPISILFLSWVCADLVINVSVVCLQVWRRLELPWNYQNMWSTSLKYSIWHRMLHRGIYRNTLIGYKWRLIFPSSFLVWMNFFGSLLMTHWGHNYWYVIVDCFLKIVEFMGC